MERQIMLCLTVICDEADLVVKATEAIARAQLGLAMENMHTTLSISPLTPEEAEQEQHEL